MTSRREDILAAVATRLSSTAGVSGRVYRSRPEALRTDAMPALIIEPISDNAVPYNTTPFVTWTLQFRVMVLARGQVPDQVADPVINSMYSLLMADRSLGGLAQDLVPLNIAFNMQDGDKPILMADCVFQATYRTQAANLET